MARIPRMTKDEVVEEIQRRYANGKPLNSGYMQRNEGRLFRSALKNFGSWKNAVEAAEIDYADVSVETRTKWSAERVLSEITRMYHEGYDLSPTNLQTNNQMLYICARRYFGGIGRALEVCGIDSESCYRRKPKWEESELYAEISRIYTETGRLDEKYYRENHRNIISVTQYYFGGWYNALRKFGLPTDQVKVYWTEELVVEYIQERNRNGISLAHSDVPNNIYIAARRAFGSWENALKACRIDESKHRKYSRWTKDLMIEKIRQIAADGVDTTFSSILLLDSPLATSYGRYFNSWDDFLKEADVYNPHYSECNTRLIGIEFEKLVRDVLERLKIEHAYQQVQPNKLRPDFVLKDGTWADAKLSSWTAFVDGTLEKYLPYTPHLTIIFLRGDEFETKEDVKLVQIDELLSRLDSEKDSDLFSRTDELKKKVSAIEKSNREEVCLVG